MAAAGPPMKVIIFTLALKPVAPPVRVERRIKAKQPLIRVFIMSPAGSTG
jgi:hypothetical protein